MRLGREELAVDRWSRIAPCFLALWPGLPKLWWFGSLMGLAQALGFALLLQLTVFTTFIWPETIGSLSRAVVWFCVLGFWLLFAAPVFGRATAVLSGGFAVGDREHLFRDAQREYLKGNWLQAERVLRRLLELDAGDVDSRLLLATLYRRVGRLAAAGEEMGRLAESHGSSKWRFEILQEGMNLARLRREAAENNRQTSAGGSHDPQELATEAA